MSIEEIIKAACAHLDTSYEVLLSRDKVKENNQHRQMIWFYLKYVGRYPYVDIGNAFAGRDHSTVMSGITSLHQKMASDNSTAPGGILSTYIELREHLEAKKEAWTATSDPQLTLFQWS